MFVDYYAILEISQTATKAEIKSAFKRQAVKWHPDKNPGKDTTKKMQEINEASLILNDDEARVRYDREYLRFRMFQEQTKKEKEQQGQKKHEEEKRAGQKQSEKKTERQKKENATFQFDDELLKKWMENARKQAIRNVHEMVVEFRDSSVIGFGTFFSTALKAIGVAIIFFILFLIISLFKK